MNSRNAVRDTITERFLILTREEGTRSTALAGVLESLGTVEVVVDRKPDLQTKLVWVPDDEAGAFAGMMSKSGPFPSITAWSRAMCHVSKTFDPREAVWFVEDDVAGDAESFAALVKRTAIVNADLSALELHTKREDPGWYWWAYADGLFSDPCRGFQPLCRLSGGLIRAVFEFQERHGRLVFHEILFASLVRERGMDWLDWNRDPESRASLGTFRYRPEVSSVSHGISHPVKDAAIQRAICSLPPPGFPRMRRASLEGWSILSEEYLFLVRYCQRHDIRRIAEFGPGDSTLAFLDAGCEVVSFEHDAEWLRTTSQRFSDEAAVTLTLCPEGSVPNSDDLPFDPELVFVDGPPYREGQTMSRLHACEWALDRCGCFILHDSKRGGEEATLAELERRGMCVARIPTRKGLAIVVDPRKRPELVPEDGPKVAAKYSGRCDWVAEHLVAWSVLIGNWSSPVRVLEIGAGDGKSANLTLDLLFTHPASEVHVIDCYDGAAGQAIRAAFEKNAAVGGHGDRLRVYDGMPAEVLAWMIAGDGYWESFDFVHLPSCADEPETLTGACQAWMLLRSGGIMTVGSHGKSPKSSSAFQEVYGSRFNLLLDGNPAVLRKL